MKHLAILLLSLFAFSAFAQVEFPKEMATVFEDGQILTANPISGYEWAKMITINPEDPSGIEIANSWTEDNSRVSFIKNGRFKKQTVFVVVRTEDGNGYSLYKCTNGKSIHVFSVEPLVEGNNFFKGFQPYTSGDILVADSTGMQSVIKFTDTDNRRKMVDGVRENLERRYPFVSLYEDYPEFYILSNCSNPYGKDKKNRKMGFATLDGKIIIEPNRFDSVSVCSNHHNDLFNFIRVQLKDSKGAYSMDGIEMVPPIQEEELHYIYREGKMQFYTMDSKFKTKSVETKGYLNSDGTFTYIAPSLENQKITQLLKEKYKSVDFDFEGVYYRLSRISSIDPEGIADVDGQILLEPKNKYSSLYYESDGMIHAVKFLDKDLLYENLMKVGGESVIPPIRYTYISQVEKYESPKWYKGFIDGKWGASDINGMELIGPYYKDLDYDKECGFYTVKGKEKVYFGIFLNPDGTLNNNLTKELALEKPESKSAKFWKTALQVLTIVGTAANAYTQVVAQNKQISSSSTMPSVSRTSSSSSSDNKNKDSSKTKKKTKIWDNNATVLSSVYRDYQSMLIKMNVKYEKEYNDQKRREYQAKMREIRQKLFDKYTDSPYHSEWEDWDGLKKK